MNVTCPHCQGAIAFNPSFAGQHVSCPHCQGLFAMPVITATMPTQVPVATVQSDAEPSLDFTSRSSSSRRRPKPQKGMNKFVLIGCGVPVAFFGLIFIM